LPLACLSMIRWSIRQTGSYCVGDLLKLVLEELTKSVTELGSIPWTDGWWVVVRVK